MSGLIEETGRNFLPRIVLLACGSFNPPTPMHFRMFEIAKDHFDMVESHKVIGGIVSPVHDDYGKHGLISATHRCAMVRIALQSSTWIRVSEWESQQSKWSRTREVLQYHQNFINNYINTTDDNMNGDHCDTPYWLPTALRNRKDRVCVKLLCGADLLESFAVPGLWSTSDIEDIVGNHGLVVVSRNGSNPEKFIFDSDILTKYQRNITLVTNWVPNEISSTMIRKLLSRGQSVKYLIDDLVEQYIKQFNLFQSKTTKYLNLNDCDQQNVINANFDMKMLFNKRADVEDDIDSSGNLKRESVTTANVFCCGATDTTNTNVLETLIQKKPFAPGLAKPVFSRDKVNVTDVIVKESEIKSKKLKRIPNV